MMTYVMIALALSAFCMVANRLSKTVITAPQVFLALGFIVAQFSMVPEIGTEEALHIVAETTLIILLFLDAAQIDVAQLRSRFVWPARMLLLGLPLAMVLGTFAGLLVFPDWSLVFAALVAAILSPTDAALGQAVISNPDVPDRPRRALIVESGLNDGLALPVILMLAVVAAPSGMAPESGWVVFAAKQLVFGPAVGLAIGYVAGRVLLWAKRTDYTSDVYEGIGALAVAIGTYLTALMIGGNGFIAAFCAGLAFGAIVRGRCKFVYEFTESEGQLLAWASFFLLGAVLVPDAIAHLTWPMAGLILVSLLVVRPLAIWLSLIGTDAAPETRLFFGWFGPRGLATALFALLVVDQLDPQLGEGVLIIAVNAVWISAVLHGLSAVPGAVLYARLSRADHMTGETKPLPHGTITGPVDHN
ncbi:MAG: cation:proton antiporter [Pseudomonadota bacterium]